MISVAAAGQGVPFSLVKGIIAQESNFVQRAYRAEPSVNDASYGLMQVLLGTARSIGYSGTAEQLYDPQTNITVGTSFLSQLLRTAANAGWGMDSAISAYNAGFSSDRPGDGKRDTDRTDGYLDDGSQLAPFINQDYVDAVTRYAAKYGQPVGSGPAPSSGGSATPMILALLAAGAVAAAIASR
jgi:soluble lytic murein transglycosylase-like protein